MSKPTHVQVTAADGRIVPIASSTATAPGGQLLLVRPGDSVELPYTSDVRRSINRGDLVIVKPSSSSSSSSKPSRSAVSKADTQPAPAQKEEG